MESHSWTPPKETLEGVAFFILASIILVPAVTEGPSVGPVLSSIYIFGSAQLNSLKEL